MPTSRGGGTNASVSCDEDFFHNVEAGHDGSSDSVVIETRQSIFLGGEKAKEREKRIIVQTVIQSSLSRNVPRLPALSEIVHVHSLPASYLHV